ncbi:MAG TPA: hypothetical protein VF282_11665, partial [Bacillota bacterium]
MPTIDVRSPVTIAAAAVLAVILALWIAVDLESQVEVRRSPLFTLPWGDLPGEVGRVEAGDRTFGPRSFTVAGDRIVVADTFNSRLLLLDRQGATLSVLEVPAAAQAGAILPGVLPVSGDGGDEPAGPGVWINDLAVGSDGRYYLADAAAPRIMVLAPDGQPAETIDIAPAAPGEDPAGDAVWLVERVAVDQDGLLYLTHAYLSDALLSRRITRLGGPDGKFAELSVSSLREGGIATDEEGLLPVPANSFAIGLDGRLYVEAAGPNLFTRRVRSYDRDIDPGGSWDVTRPEPVHSADVLGASPEGWVFLAVNPGRPQGRVVVLTGGGEGGVLHELDPGWNAGFEANVHARLAEDGLYVARAGPDGWSLD